MAINVVRSCVFGLSILLASEGGKACQVSNKKYLVSILYEENIDIFFMFHGFKHVYRV